jgi:hypothetical protein
MPCGSSIKTNLVHNVRIGFRVRELFSQLEPGKPRLAIRLTLHKASFASSLGAANVTGISIAGALVHPRSIFHSRPPLGPLSGGLL